jgi:hypothetical protein
MADQAQINQIAEELIRLFRVQLPPVPIEAMLQHPLPGMWEEVDISQVSGSYLTIGSPYLPRMSLARVLARHIAGSAWGTERGLRTLLGDAPAISALARAVIMPRSMIEMLAPAALTAATVSDHFEVPLREAAARLEELNSAP